MVAECSGASGQKDGGLDRAFRSAGAASLWEISIKAALGKLKADPQEVLEAVDPAGFDLLPVQGTHAVGVFSPGPQHGDPFDRLLVAQAQAEHATLLTFDEALLAYGKAVRLVG